MSYLEIKNLTAGYDGKAVCGEINFSLEKGDYLCIVGENGAGKSTFMKTLLGLIPAVSGKIEKGEQFTGIGYLPQRSQAQKDFPATVWEIVLSGCVKKSGLRPFYNKQEKALAREKMELMEITPLKDKSFSALSGGQQQRVLLARALCAADGCLLLDEPVTGLDPKASEELYSAVEKLNKERGITVITVTHDVEKGLAYADKVLEISHYGNFFGTADEYQAYKRNKEVV
ncbi:MAG: ABC transporter ATP-binding protein [Clostridia bacterium]|nr:ABC transporter ATP-binding protein [Clostridia bacterium]